MFVDQVKRQKRMPQMVKHAHENHHVELFPEPGNVIDRELPELYVKATDLRGKAGLRKIDLVEVDADDPVRAAFLHLNRVEAGVTSDIEDRPAFQIGRNRVRKIAPLDVRVVAEEMVRRSTDAAQIQIVKPLPQLCNFLLDSQCIPLVIQNHAVCFHTRACSSDNCELSPRITTSCRTMRNSESEKLFSGSGLLRDGCVASA